MFSKLFNIQDYYNINYPTVFSGILAALFDVGVKEATAYSNYFRIDYFLAGRGSAVEISIDTINDVSLFG